MKIHIGANIKELRKRKNITQEKLAEYLGITYQTISKWEMEHHCRAFPYCLLLQTFLM